MKIRKVHFHFYSDEGNEPPYIHVRCAGAECKFWLAPVGLANNHGMPPHDVREIEYLVFENRDFLICKYHEHHESCN